MVMPCGFTKDVLSDVISSLYNSENDGEGSTKEEYSEDGELPELGMRSETFDEQGRYKFCPNCHLKLSNTEKANRKCYSCEEKF